MRQFNPQNPIRVEVEMQVFESEIRDLLVETDAFSVEQTLSVLAMAVRWLRTTSGNGSLTLAANNNAFETSFTVEQKLHVTRTDEWPEISRQVEMATEAPIRAAS